VREAVQGRIKIGDQGSGIKGRGSGVGFGDEGTSPLRVRTDSVGGRRKKIREVVESGVRDQGSGVRRRESELGS
jgi:hypothetical protein